MGSTAYTNNCLRCDILWRLRTKKNPLPFDERPCPLVIGKKQVSPTQVFVSKSRKLGPDWICPNRQEAKAVGQ